MIVLFIVAVVGAIALLYYWSQTVSATKQDFENQSMVAEEAEGRAQYVLNETRQLWDQILQLEQLQLTPARHRLLLELNLLLPYLWQPDPKPFYINEAKTKVEPLINEVNDPVINQLWIKGTLESVNKIPLTIIGQLHEPAYDPDLGVVRQHDLWYPTLELWGNNER